MPLPLVGSGHRWPEAITLQRHPCVSYPSLGLTWAPTYALFFVPGMLVQAASFRCPQRRSCSSASWTSTPRTLSMGRYVACLLAPCCQSALALRGPLVLPQVPTRCVHCPAWVLSFWQIMLGTLISQDCALGLLLAIMPALGGHSRRPSSDRVARCSRSCSFCCSSARWRGPYRACFIPRFLRMLGAPVALQHGAVPAGHRGQLPLRGSALRVPGPEPGGRRLCGRPHALRSAPLPPEATFARFVDFPRLDMLGPVIAGSVHNVLRARFEQREGAEAVKENREAPFQLLV